MKKVDLVTGMSVVLRNGSRYFVLKGTANGDLLTALTGNSFMYLDDVNDDLECNDDDKQWDIVEVYASAQYGNICVDYGDLLWTRPVSQTVMTISEIEKKLGVTNLHIKD